MGRVSESKYMVNAGWDDVPHLDAATKRQLLDSTPPYLRDARSKGIPSLGSGAIFPIPENEIIVQPFTIPNYWPRAYGMDVGWNMTAAMWLAKNPDDGTFYAYAEHGQGQSLPIVHVSAIKARGDWVRGAIDPASRGRTQDEGKQLFATYTGLGLHVTPALNGVDAGLFEMWTAFSTGKLKIFSTLQGFLNEYRYYRRDEHGKVVKKNDHRIDSLRYAYMTFHLVGSVRSPKTDMTNVVTIADRKAGY